MFHLATHSTYLYLCLYDVGYMVKDHSDSERGNQLPHLQGLLFPISSKGSFICTTQQTGKHIPLLHQSWSTEWNEKYGNGSTMKDRSEDPSLHLAPRSFGILTGKENLSL